MKKKRVPVAESESTSEALRRVVERQMDHLRAYKTRQDDIVRELGKIQAILNRDGNDLAQMQYQEDAKDAIASLLSRDLAQAKDRQDNHRFALDMAIKTLERHDKNRDVADTLSQMELLVPEAFEKAPAAIGAAS